MGVREKISSLWVRFLRRASLSSDTAVEATIESVKSEVELRGTNVWVLAFAIVIASVGLNVNSTAVIIGAMLISPLMGPIIGLGLSVGILDMELFKRALKNLLLMVAISLVASTLYFFLSPLNDAQSELLARTRPTIYDVLIAFFGGLAGIVAKTRKEQSIVTISGVAIATALMPPLCTAGYGLATAQWSYFFGAFYLFFINSFFIATATFAMVRFLNFPLKSEANQKRQKRAKAMLYVFATIVMIPSVITAVIVIRESTFNTAAVKYINSIQNNEFFVDQELIKYEKEYDSDSSLIVLTFVGQNLTATQYDYLYKHLNDYSLDKTRLEIKELNGNPIDWDKQNDLWVNLIDKKDVKIREQDSVINSLRSQLAIAQGNDDELYSKLLSEMQITYESLKSISVSEMFSVDDNSQSKITSVMYVTWQKMPNEDEQEKVVRWLRLRLSKPDLEIKMLVEE
ncbi:MAG: TIGR00341 family protein [Paludibacteraceae bacterium]|nr:TIGR00341 family protein [Paludibacteraceae bacterium]